MLKKLIRDLIGLYKIVGFTKTIKWLIFIFIQLYEVLKNKNLEPADKLMGTGPIKVRMNKKSASLSGVQVFSGIREIWVRNCYLLNYFNFDNDELVVDLGANIGVFTQLALSQNSKLKTISVEPNLRLLKCLQKSVENNGWSERSSTLRSFIGHKTKTQITGQTTKNYKGVNFISENDFIKRYSIKKIDFLKIDIEGSEFAFINSKSKILDLCNKLAIEIHEHAGDIASFIESLKLRKFKVHSIDWARGGCILLASKL